MHPGLAGSRALILSVIDSAKTLLIDPQTISFDDSYDTSYGRAIDRKLSLSYTVNIKIIVSMKKLSKFFRTFALRLSA